MSDKQGVLKKVFLFLNESWESDLHRGTESDLPAASQTGKLSLDLVWEQDAKFPKGIWYIKLFFVFLSFKVQIIGRELLR